VAGYWTELTPKAELEQKLHAALLEARERLARRGVFYAAATLAKQRLVVGMFDPSLFGRQLLLKEGLFVASIAPKNLRQFLYSRNPKLIIQGLPHEYTHCI